MQRQQMESQLTSTFPSRITSTPSRKAETAANLTNHVTHAPTLFTQTLHNFNPTTQRTTTTKKNSGHVCIHTQGRRTATTTKSQTKTTTNNHCSNNNQRHGRESDTKQHRITKQGFPADQPHENQERRGATTDTKNMQTDHTNKNQTETSNAQQQQPLQQHYQPTVQRG